VTAERLADDRDESRPTEQPDCNMQAASRISTITKPVTSSIAATMAHGRRLAQLRGAATNISETQASPPLK